MVNIFNNDFGNPENTENNRFEIEGYKKDTFNAVFDLAESDEDDYVPELKKESLFGMN